MWYVSTVYEWFKESRNELHGTSISRLILDILSKSSNNTCMHTLKKLYSLWDTEERWTLTSVFISGVHPCGTTITWAWTFRWTDTGGLWARRNVERAGGVMPPPPYQASGCRIWNSSMSSSWLKVSRWGFKVTVNK